MITRNFPLRAGLVAITFLVTAGIAAGQHIEVTPFVGTRLYGTVKLESADTSRTGANIAGSISYGVAAGYRWESDESADHDQIEFRWIRQDSHLQIKPSLPQVNPLGAALSISTLRPSVSLDHFLADFSREFAVQDSKALQPFLTVGLGISRLATSESSAMRFGFDVGGGVKVFPTNRFGFRLTVEYLGTVMHADLQRVACLGGCVYALSGGVLNQLSFTIGPAFRF